MTKKRIITLVTMLLLAGIVVFATGCQKKNSVNSNNKGEETPKENTEKSESELLFSFESYKEITGTKLILGHQFGKTAINTDKQYITDGKASWKLEPQGNYKEKGRLPYFRLKCEDTTIKTNNFNGYDKVSLDFYNDSDEEVTIKWSFQMLNDMQAYAETDLNEYVLAPKAWTTCDYDLSSVVYGSYFNPSFTKYMTVYFCNGKESKEDTSIDTLYVDNFRGYFSETERENVGVDFDLEKGITFEVETDKYLFKAPHATVDAHKFDMSWVKYEDIAVAPKDDSQGKYCLMADSTGAKWPTFTLNYGKTYEKGLLLTYRLYVEVDEAQAKDKFYKIESFISEADRTSYGMKTGDSKFNKWIDVYQELPAASSSMYTFINLDYAAFPVDLPVKIYLDNFKIIEQKGTTSVADDGTVTMINPYNATDHVYKVNRSAKKGDTFSFDIDFNMKDQVAVWVLADDGWVDISNEYYAWHYDAWSGKQTISVVVPKDTKTFDIRFQYRGESKEFESYVATISNIIVDRDKMTVKDDGSVVMQNNVSATSTLKYQVNREVKKDDVITFDVDISNGTTAAVWVLGDKADVWDEWYAYQYDTWPQKEITVTAPNDAKYFTIRIEYREGTSDAYRKAVTTISNINISRDVVLVGADGSVTFQNKASGSNWNQYTFQIPVKKGDTITFDLGISTGLESAVWVLGDKVDVWDEWYAYQYDTWPQKEIKVTAPNDAEYFKIRVEYREGEKADFKEAVTIINNVGVSADKVDVALDGSVTIKNTASGSNTCKYTFAQPVKKGDAITFAVDISTGLESAVWVLGDKVDVWDEWFAWQYDAWPQEITILAPNDAEYFTIRVEYREGTATDYKEAVTTITKPVISKDLLREEADGSVTAQNAVSGSQEVSWRFNQEVKAGEQITFDVNISNGLTAAIWVLSDNLDEWEEWSVGEYSTWPTTITLTAPKDAAFFRVHIEYRYATTADYKEAVTTISKPEISMFETTAIDHDKNDIGPNLMYFKTEHDDGLFTSGEMHYNAISGGIYVNDTLYETVKFRRNSSNGYYIYFAESGLPTPTDGMTLRFDGVFKSGNSEMKLTSKKFTYNASTRQWTL